MSIICTVCVLSSHTRMCDSGSVLIPRGSSFDPDGCLVYEKRCFPTRSVTTTAPAPLSDTTTSQLFLSVIWLGILYSSSPVLSCCIFVSVVRSDYTGLSCLQVQCFHLNNTLLSQIYPSRPVDPQLTGRRTHTVVSMYNMFSL